MKNHFCLICVILSFVYQANAGVVISINPSDLLYTPMTIDFEHEVEVSIVNDSAALADGLSGLTIDITSALVDLKTESLSGSDGNPFAFDFASIADGASVGEYSLAFGRTGGNVSIPTTQTRLTTLKFLIPANYSDDISVTFNLFSAVRGSAGDSTSATGDVSVPAGTTTISAVPEPSCVLSLGLVLTVWGWKHWWFVRTTSLFAGCMRRKPSVLNR